MTDGLSEAYEEKQWDVFCENNELLLENDQLQVENAKLRNLVSDLYFDLLGEMPESMLEDRRLQMRELGIEV